MRILKKLLLGLTLSTFAIGSQALPVTLQSLFEGGEIRAGDKLFTDWIWWSEGDNPLDVVNPANILVTADASDALNPALIFNMGTGLSDVSPNGPDYVNLDFGYRVDVLDPNFSIKSTSTAFADGTFVSSSAGVGVTSFIQDENFFDVGLTDIFLEQPPLAFQNPDSASLDNLDLIYVDHYVELYSQGGEAGLTGFTQSFMQVEVPAPPTLLLFGLALLGLRLSRRK